MASIITASDWRDDPAAVRHRLASWGRARIQMKDGKLLSVRRRLIPTYVSVAQVWWQAKFQRPQGDTCRLDYHQPMGMRGVVTLDYVLSGDQASYRTIVGACHILDAIAESRGALTIVAHVSNGSISDRLLTRLGWEEHLLESSGRHWIKRFYDGYPPSQVHRYL